MKTEKPERIFSIPNLLLWVCRIISGGAFIVSGWAKSIDPWGFIYKIEDYMHVWQISMPRELILCGAIALSLAEFTTGVCLLCGMMRRTALWCASAMMAFMLPLTIYIAVANPVSDCGCFGDFIILSNNATLIKNIIIVIALAALFKLRNSTGACLIRPALQWIAISLTVLYILIVALYGYNIQPLADFRPYKAGTDLAALLQSANEADESDDMLFVYSRDGEERSFGLDEIPDSSWTFVRREQNAKIKSVANDAFGIYDSDGNDVSSELIGHDSGTMMLVVVADPGLHYLSRSRFVNEIAETIRAGGGDIIGLVGAPYDVVEQWSDLALPDFDVYSADDTALKTLVRGDAALVLLENGRIIWKRTVSSLDADFTNVHSDMSSYLEMPPADRPIQLIRLSAAYLCLMAITATLRRKKNKASNGGSPKNS